MTSPSVVPAPIHAFATHIPNRRPEFKTHKGVGQAKNAVIQKLRNGVAGCDMTIYKLDGGEYVPWLRIESGQKRDEVPELAPKPKPRSHVAWEIQSLAEQEQRYLKLAEASAAKRRELEAAR